MEDKRGGVDAVANVLRRDALTGEDMPQMPPARGADDLGSNAVGIKLPCDRPGDPVVEGRPAAIGAELAV